MSHKLIRDDIKAGAFLNKKLEGMPYDFKQAKCYYKGDPIELAFCFSHFEELGTDYGWQATISIATGDNFTFSGCTIGSGLAFFFKDAKMHNIRLQALTPSWNRQALRLVKAAGFTREGVLREYLPNGDIVVSSMLKKEFDKKYGNI